MSFSFDSLKKENWLYLIFRWIHRWETWGVQRWGQNAPATFCLLFNRNISRVEAALKQSSSCTRTDLPRLLRSLLCSFVILYISFWGTNETLCEVAFIRDDYWPDETSFRGIYHYVIWNHCLFSLLGRGINEKSDEMRESFLNQFTIYPRSNHTFLCLRGNY